jgi:hypothetical protein
MEVPVWIGSETDLIHIYKIFFSFSLWAVSGVLLILGFVSILRQSSEFLQPGRAFSALEPILACGFGALALASVFLPWANVEVINPTISRLEFGSFTVERYHSLSGFSLVSANYWEGDMIYMVFVGRHNFVVFSVNGSC